MPVGGEGAKPEFPAALPSRPTPLRARGEGGEVLDAKIRTV